MSSTVPQPRHVAIIMDGNGRWARQKGKPRAFGHQAGFHNTRDIVEACGKRRIEALTLFAFSSENWRRPDKEVGLLMDLFLRALKSEVGKLNENGVQIQFIGERSAFSDKLQSEMFRAEELTKNNDGLKLAIAVNYGGRWDIVNATQRLLISPNRIYLFALVVKNALVTIYFGIWPTRSCISPMYCGLASMIPNLIKRLLFLVVESAGMVALAIK